MTPRWISPSDPEMKTIRCRGLPDDVTGDVRVLEMDTIDKNLCCGTHGEIETYVIELFRFCFRIHVCVCVCVDI